MNIKNFNLFFIFAYNIPSLTIHFYVFDLSYLKIILEIIFRVFCSAKYACYFLWFQNKMVAHSLFLRCPYIPILTSICSYNLHHIHYVFRSVNLTLRMVTSTSNIQKIEQKQVDTRRQDGTCWVTSRRMIQVLKEKEINLINKNVWQKRKGMCWKEECNWYTMWK